MKKLVLLVVLLAVFGCGESCAPPNQDNALLTTPNVQHGSPSEPVPESPTSIIQEALRLDAAKENEKAAILEEMAFLRMRRNPSSVPAVWHLFQTQIERLKGSPADYASRLDVFMAEARGALSECQSISEFSATWDVIKEIEIAVQCAHSALYALALKELAQASEGIGVPATSFVDDIRALISMRNSPPSDTNGRALPFVLTSSLVVWDDEDSLGDKTQPQDATLKEFYGAVEVLVASILSKGDAFLTSELDRLSQEADKDRRGECIEPLPDVTGGTYQQAIAAFQGLQTEIEAVDLVSWALIAQADFSEQIDSIGTKLAELSWKSTELQALRYNIWALRQIRLAESAQSWPDILGAIDLHNLDPSVSSVYSLTYDDLIRKESDPLRRDSCVRTLLSKEKIRLEQF